METIKQKLINSGWHEYQAEAFVDDLKGIANTTELNLEEIFDFIRSESREGKVSDKDNLNSVVGELCIKEKYKFLPNGLVGEVVRDAFEELKKIEY